MAAEATEAVVRVTAQNLNRLMGLAGESLVQARWLDPFATALLKLKKQQDHLAGVLESVGGENGFALIFVKSCHGCELSR